jgi:hypothetical protein
MSPRDFIEDTLLPWLETEIAAEADGNKHYIAGFQQETRKPGGCRVDVSGPLQLLLVARFVERQASDGSGDRRTHTRGRWRYLRHGAFLLILSHKLGQQVICFVPERTARINQLCKSLL